MLAVGLETLVPAAAALILLVRWLSWQPWFHPFGAVAARVDTDERVVALTFDDGPTALGVDAVLPILARAGISATFYVNGVHLRDNPELGRRLVAAGHEIGNHGYSHRPLAFVRPRTVGREIEATDRAIRAVGFLGPITFRPPYGRKLIALPFYLARRGRTTVMWNVAPDLGAWTKPPDRMVADAMARLRPGSILLLHPMFPANEHARQALAGLLATIRAQGYRFVTVTDLLRRGRPIGAPLLPLHPMGAD